MRFVQALGPLLLVLAGTAACSTTSEIDRLDQTLTRKVDALTASLRAEVRDLKNDLRGQERRHDEMAKLLDSLKTIIYSNAESLRRSNESLERETKALLQSMADEGNLRAQLLKDHEQVQQTIVALTKSMDGLTPLAGTLDAQVRQVTGVLQENYRSELRLLRERLRILEEMARPSGNGHPHGAPAVGENAPKGSQESRARGDK